MNLTFYNGLIYVNGEVLNIVSFDEYLFRVKAIEKSPTWGRLLKYPRPTDIDQSKILIIER